MPFVATLSQFHVALDGVGLILAGAPDRPAYRVNNAPVYGTRFASGDRDYNDLSQWWYLTQTDWSGGIKDDISWADDAKYYYSSNIDAYTQPGELRLQKKLVTGYDNSANSGIRDVKAVLYNATTNVVFLDELIARDFDTGVQISSTGGGSFVYQTTFKGYYWQFANNGVLNTFDGTTTSAKQTQIDAVIDGSVSELFGGAVIGNTIFVVGRSTTNNIFWVKTSVANPTVSGDWTLVSEVVFSANADVNGFDVLGSEILYVVENPLGADTFQLYTLDSATGISVLLQEFHSDPTSNFYYGERYVKKFNDFLLITVPNTVDEDGAIYKYNGIALEKIWETDFEKKALGYQATGWIKGGCTVLSDKAYWGNLVYDGSVFHNFIKTIDDNITDILAPVGFSTSANRLYLTDTKILSGDSQTIAYSFQPNGTTFKNGTSDTAFLVMSLHDKLPSIDKLLNTVSIGFKRFASGESIEIYYSTIPNPTVSIADWTLLSTASHSVDGALVTSKILAFPVGTIAKKVWFRIQLKSTTTTTTPSLTDFTLEYLPIPDYKKEWNLNINCGDEVKKLSGRLVETTGRELRSRLEKAWWTKSTLDYQDLDYATTLVNDASFDATETTITVVDTADFPEQGRLRVDNEEILYTNKTPTTFTGCTRGARGTLATTHANSSVINNAYKVLVMSINETAPVLLEDKQLEYVVGLSLREV